jgi:hypothetical protein
MSIADLQKATLAARQRTGMQGIGTQASRGLFQVVLVTMTGRKTTVDPLSGFVSLPAAVEVLNQMEAA